MQPFKDLIDDLEAQGFGRDDMYTDPHCGNFYFRKWPVDGVTIFVTDDLLRKFVKADIIFLHSCFGPQDIDYDALFLNGQTWL